MSAKFLFRSFGLFLFVWGVAFYAWLGNSNTSSAIAFNLPQKASSSATHNKPNTNTGVVSGTVSAIASDSFTLALAPSGSITLQVISTTVFEQNHQQVPFSTMQVGMFVGAAISGDGAGHYQALRVSLPATNACNPTPYSMSGKVTDKEATSFSFVTTSTSNQQPFTMTVQVTSATVFYQNKQAVTYANLQVGMEITVAVESNCNGGYNALNVYLPAPSTCTSNPFEIDGQVTAKQEKSFTLSFTNSQNQQVSRTVYVTANSQFYLGNQLSSFSALQVGMNVKAVLQANCEGQYYEAYRIYMPASTTCSTTPFEIDGQVTAKQEKSFTLSFVNTEKHYVSRTVYVTPDSKFYLGNQPSSFSALQIGMNIKALLVANCEGKYYEAYHIYMPTPTTCNVKQARLSGTVTDKEASYFTVSTANSSGQTLKTKFYVTSTTTFYHNGNKVDYSDLKANSKISFTVQNNCDGTYSAVEVTIY